VHRNNTRSFVRSFIHSFTHSSSRDAGGGGGPGVITQSTKFENNHENGQGPKGTRTYVQLPCYMDVLAVNFDYNG